MQRLHSPQLPGAVGRLPLLLALRRHDDGALPGGGGGHKHLGNRAVLRVARQHGLTGLAPTLELIHDAGDDVQRDKGLGPVSAHPRPVPLLCSVVPPWGRIGVVTQVHFAVRRTDHAGERDGGGGVWEGYGDGTQVGEFLGPCRVRLLTWARGGVGRRVERVVGHNGRGSSGHPPRGCHALVRVAHPAPARIPE